MDCHLRKNLVTSVFVYIGDVVLEESNPVAGTLTSFDRADPNRRASVITDAGNVSARLLSVLTVCFCP